MQWLLMAMIDGVTYSGRVGFIDERLEIVDVAVSVGVLEQNGWNWFIDLGDLVQVDHVDFETEGLRSRLHAGDGLRVQTVRHQERLPLVNSVAIINYRWLA